METNKTKEFIIRQDCFGNIYIQTELVRCEDCKHYATKRWCKELGEYHDKDWFCADGEKRE